MRVYIGEFEELVLLTTGILDPDGYAVNISAEIQAQTGRSITISAVHTALHRLEEKGYLDSYFGEATEIRGGKRKRLFKLTSAGVVVLRETRELRNSLWSQLPKVVLRIA
jgi:PadR family transcriptional regulator, regulatory protein PadR